MKGRSEHLADRAEEAAGISLGSAQVAVKAAGKDKSAHRENLTDARTNEDARPNRGRASPRALRCDETFHLGIAPVVDDDLTGDDAIGGRHRRR